MLLKAQNLVQRLLEFISLLFTILTIHSNESIALLEIPLAPANLLIPYHRI